MEALRVIVLLIAASFVYGRNEFRPDYEFHASASGWFKFHKVPVKWYDARLMCDFEGNSSFMRGGRRLNMSERMEIAGHIMAYPDETPVQLVYCVLKKSGKCTFPTSIFLGAVLASPINEDVYDVMKRIISKTEHVPTGVYTGVHNTVISQVFNSIEGVPLSALPVRTRDMFSEEYNSGVQCARLLPQEGLVAGSCNDVLPYICYKKQTAELRMTECGTVDTGYQLSAKTGHCYKFHAYALPWSLAFLRCIAEGGQLAIINSAVEADVLKELFAKHPASSIRGRYKEGVYLGFHNWNEKNVWRTNNGQSLKEAGYSNWGNGQPDNFRDAGQNCGAMFRTGQLDDIECSKLAFICEKHPNNILPVPNNV